MNFAASESALSSGSCCVSFLWMDFNLENLAALQKKEFLKMGTSAFKKVPIFVPTTISEGENLILMEYVWKGVKILLKVLFTLWNSK